MQDQLEKSHKCMRMATCMCVSVCMCAYFCVRVFVCVCSYPWVFGVNSVQDFLEIWTSKMRLCFESGEDATVRHSLKVLLTDVLEEQEEEQTKELHWSTSIF